MLRTLFSFVSLWVMAGSLIAQVGAVNPLEHFQCYSVLKQDPDPSGHVVLRDQFGPDEADVRRAVKFCNPTRKIHRNRAFGVNDVDQHLTFYVTHPQTAPHRVAIIRNQFGRQQLRIREPIALAVPTKKEGHEFPKMDHYRCYAASGKEVRDVVGLSDQFILPVTRHRVIEPVAFCNPVAKLHDGQEFPIQNEKAHLTCYSMTRVKFAKEISIANQFAEQRLAVGPPDTLCVPTEKLRWAVIPDSDGPAADLPPDPTTADFVP